MAGGALSAADRGTRCILFGPEADVRAALGDEGARSVAIVDCLSSITNSEEPARAVRAKPDASIVRAAKAVGEGEADALVSAGPTGAVLAASLLNIKRLPGVYRPAVALLLPLPAGQILFLDVGANVEVRPDHLVQFAYMGAAFSESVLGVERPRIGLLSVGEESEKGTPDVVAAHRRLAESKLNFGGNVEGDRLTSGDFDVVVTDGFTGNVALKLMEGTVRLVGAAIRDAARSGPLSMLGGLLLRPALKGLRERLDPETVGGAYLLGLRRPVVICHGGSRAKAIANAIALADHGVGQKVVERTSDALAAGSAMRAGKEPDDEEISTGLVRQR